MSALTTVEIITRDPLYAAGLRALLRPHREISLVEASNRSADPQVAVVVAESVDEDARVALRRIRHTSTTRSVLVVTKLTDQAAFKAVGCGATGLMLRSQATPEHLLHVIHLVGQGGGYMPSDLLGALLTEISSAQDDAMVSQGQDFTGLSDREIDVVRLIAEGHDTEAIARRLGFSERTVTNTLHHVLGRHRLRNRTHAVSFAIRHGLI